MGKKIISILLCIALVLSVTVTAVSAEEYKAESFSAVEIEDVETDEAEEEPVLETASEDKEKPTFEEFKEDISQWAAGFPLVAFTGILGLLFYVPAIIIIAFEAVTGIIA